MTACTTVENRRDLYSPQTVQGPYTRLLRHNLRVSTPTPIESSNQPTGHSGKEVIKPRG